MMTSNNTIINNTTTAACTETTHQQLLFSPSVAQHYFGGFRTRNHHKNISTQFGWDNSTSTSSTTMTANIHNHNNNDVPSKDSSSSSSSLLSSTSTRNSAMAGYAAGISGTVIGYPLDSAKVWLQTNSVGRNRHMMNNYNQQQHHHQVVVLQQHQRHHHHQHHPSIVTATMNGTYGNVTTSTTTSTTAGTTTGGGQGSIGTASFHNHANISNVTMNNNTTSSSSQRLRCVVQTVRALYSGVSGPLVAVGIIQAVNFATYDTTRRFLYQQQQQQHQYQYRQHQHQYQQYTDDQYLNHDPLTNVGTAGIVSGMVTAFITAPLVFIKTHQQITGSTFRQAVRETLLASANNNNTSHASQQQQQFRLRLGGCISGFIPHLVAETLGRGLYYVTYEGLKRQWVRWKSNEHNNNNNHPYYSSTMTTTTTTLSLQDRMVCAASAGIVCWAVIFPFDTLRSRLYSNHAIATANIMDGRCRIGMFEMINIMRKERSFYRGFWITVLRAGPVAAAVLPVYDLTLETLSRRDQ